LAKRLFYVVILSCIIFHFHTSIVFASNVVSTSYSLTYTINERIEVTKDAYLPSGIYIDLGLNRPRDLFIKNDLMYIADTGNRRIIAVDLKTSAVSVIAEDFFMEPSGVSADKYGRIYVADPGKGEAYRFNAKGELEFIFKRPETPNFGITQSFNPRKIAPADDGGVYVLSEGNVTGIVHLSGQGDFLGYFASNEVRISLFQRFQDVFLTDQQQRTFLDRTPPSFGNIHRGYDGLVYSLNRGSSVYVKKHSISGHDLFGNKESRILFEEPMDLHVTEDGRILVLTSNGRVTEMTYDGYLIVSWGGSSNRSDRIGLFELPVGIGGDSQGNIYVLDEQRAFIQVFSPTPVQKNIHNALNAYNNGLYDESRSLWGEVLKFNNTSFLAHLYIARTYLQMTEYEKAMDHFGIAKVRSGYSTAYWEIRNTWLQSNLGLIMVMLLIAYGIVLVLKITNKRRNMLGFIDKAKKTLLSIRLVTDISLVNYALHHPIDNNENIKYGISGSYHSATILYAFLFVLFILNHVGRGFIYSLPLQYFSLLNSFLYFAIILGLFICSNYFISAVNDGSGTFKAIYIGTAYSFAPALMLMPLLIIISNFATLNESFIISAFFTVILCWCMVNIVLMVITIHEYTFRSALYNIFMTLFFMGVIVLAASFAYLLLNQVVEFIIKLVTEVMLRAQMG